MKLERPDVPINVTDIDSFLPLTLPFAVGFVARRRRGRLRPGVVAAETVNLQRNVAASAAALVVAP
jgi:hypothetical protein